MRFHLLVASVAAGTLPLLGAGPAPAQDVPYLARFRGREIDLRPHVAIDRQLIFAAPGRVLVRVRTPDRAHWRLLPASALDDPARFDPMAGIDVYPSVDLARRHISPPRRDSLANLWIARGDTANREHFDLYRAVPGTAEVERLTSDGRIGAFSSMGGRVAYLSQVGEKEPYGTCLNLLNVRSRAVRRLACDDAIGVQGEALWRPDGGAFVMSAWGDKGRRLALFTVQGDSARLSDPLAGRDSLRNPVALRWVDAHRLRFTATGAGARGVYDLDTRSGTLVRLLSLPGNVAVDPAGPVMLGGREVVLTRRREQGSTRLSALELQSGRQLATTLLPEDHFFRGWNGKARWVISRNGPESPYEFDVLTLAPVGDSAAFRLEPLHRPDEASRRAAQTCRHERVSYPTFDGTPVTAVLYTPRSLPADARDRLGIIVAFYGGGGEYDPMASLWCAAGITTLSPLIRGDGEDPEWAGLTHGDRGGDEIVDAIYAARWLQERLGVRPRQIGTFGMSRGGYNALRLLTFDPRTNGRDASFDFGFGIAEAGYSSLLTILHNTNTESPEIIATGDPGTEEGRRRLRDRSPLDQVHRLDAPLLLVHGTNDSRVRVEESRQMHAAALRAGKDVELLELAGEGHGIAAEQNILRYYHAQLAFLDRVRAGLRGGAKR